MESGQRERKTARPTSKQNNTDLENKIKVLNMCERGKSSCSTIHELGLVLSTTNMTQNGSACIKHVKGSVPSKPTAITKCHFGAIFKVEVTDNMNYMKYSVDHTCECCTHKRVI